MSVFVRACAVAFAMIAGVAFGAQPTAMAQSPSATIEMQAYRGAYLFGVTAGEGLLYYRGRAYPIGMRGVSIGLSIGGSTSDVVGEVYGLHSLYDIEGTYTATNSSYAVAGGSGGLVLTNARGVEIHLHSTQIGLEFSLDVSGISISLL